MTRSEIEDAWHKEIESRRVAKIKRRAHSVCNGYTSAKLAFNSGSRRYLDNGWVDLCYVIHWLHDICELKTFKEVKPGLYVHYLGKFEISGVGVVSLFKGMRMKVNGATHG